MIEESCYYVEGIYKEGGWDGSTPGALKAIRNSTHQTLKLAKDGSACLSEEADDYLRGIRGETTTRV